MELSQVDSHFSEDLTTGFVRIAKKGKAQQTIIEIERFKELSKILGALYNLGIKEVVVTVENDSPLVIGSKTIGLAIAPRVYDET
jgi:hypothetical protein